MRFHEWLDELETICRTDGEVHLDDVIPLTDPRLKRYWKDGSDPREAYHDFVESTPEKEEFDPRYEL